MVPKPGQMPFQLEKARQLRAWATLSVSMFHLHCISNLLMRKIELGLKEFILFLFSGETNARNSIGCVLICHNVNEINKYH